MRSSAYKTTVLVVLYSAMSSICTGSELSGIVRVVLPNQQVKTIEDISPSPFTVLTLCSDDRVYRVNGDNDGKFKFESIAPGSYYFVVAAHLMSPKLLSWFKFVGNEAIPFVAVLYSTELTTSTCYVSTEGEANLLREFKVLYGTNRGQNATPRIEGEVLGYLDNDGRGVHTRRLSKAIIRLFRPAETAPVLTTKADARGSFQLQPSAPGVYELRMEQEGYNEVKVPAFIVPRENVTQLVITAAKVDTIVVRQE